MSVSSLLVKGLKKGRWAWNDKTNDLQFVSLLPEKKQKKVKEKVGTASINGLTYAALKVNLKFKETVTDQELIEFRHYLRVLNKSRTDSFVTIQDCKIVALFLCVQQLPRLFHQIYSLWHVNQLLRACIVYMQFYLQTSETIVKTQHFLRGNSVPKNKTSTYQALKEDLDDLRVLIGRFYVIVMTELSNLNISQTDEILMFEYFLRVSTEVVWIALERKYLSVIKVELERIFRTRYFNNFNQDESDSILNSIKKENLMILDGKITTLNKKKVRVPSRLASNSPIIHNFLHMDEPKLIMIGRSDFEGIPDDRLKFFTKYMFVPENEIQQEGISVGILGLNRRLFDPLLYPCSKRTLKLLITGSPMDIAEERKILRETALKKAMRESEPRSPHIFDELPKIPRPNQFTEKVVDEIEEVLETTEQQEEKYPEEIRKETEDENNAEEEEEEGEEEQEENPDEEET